MYKFFYILLFISGLSFICSAENGGDKVSGQTLKQEINEIRYKIIVSDRTINISPLPPKSFVLIFDSSGRNVFKQIVKDTSVNIPVRSGGVYIIRIQNGEEIFTRKILVS